eukprot:scaffold4190_cov91-Skeletonema_dohrnii-CCMP3373.AAC.3
MCAASQRRPIIEGKAPQHQYLARKPSPEIFAFALAHKQHHNSVPLSNRVVLPSTYPNGECYDYSTIVAHCVYINDDNFFFGHSYHNADNQPTTSNLVLKREMSLRVFREADTNHFRLRIAPHVLSSDILVIVRLRCLKR